MYMLTFGDITGSNPTLCGVTKEAAASLNKYRRYYGDFLGNSEEEISKFFFEAFLIPGVYLYANDGGAWDAAKDLKDFSRGSLEGLKIKLDLMTMDKTKTSLMMVEQEKMATKMTKTYEEIIKTFCKVYDLRLSRSMFFDKHRVMILDSICSLCRFLKVDSSGETRDFLAYYDSSISREDACKKIVDLILESYELSYLFRTSDEKVFEKLIPLSSFNTLEELLVHLDIESGGSLSVDNEEENGMIDGRL